MVLSLCGGCVQVLGVEQLLTLRTPDVRYPRLLSQPLHWSPLAVSILSTPPPLSPRVSPRRLYPLPPAPAGAATDATEIEAQRRLTDFAGNTWDLATGGLKTKAAKRQLPPRLERHASEQAPHAAEAQRSLTFAFVILACAVVMLVSGGIVLLVLLQP